MLAHGKLKMDTEEVMKCFMYVPHVITKRFHKGNSGRLKCKEDMHDICYSSVKKTCNIFVTAHAVLETYLFHFMQAFYKLQRLENSMEHSRHL